MLSYSPCCASFRHSQLFRRGMLEVTAFIYPQCGEFREKRVRAVVTCREISPRQSGDHRRTLNNPNTVGVNEEAKTEDRDLVQLTCEIDLIHNWGFNYQLFIYLTNLYLQLFSVLQTFLPKCLL